MLENLRDNNCDRCNASLRNGWATFWQAGKDAITKMVETICLVCDEKQRLSDFTDSKKITHHLIMDAVSASFNGDSSEELKEVMQFYENFKSRIKNFEQKVWFGGLQEIVREEKARGMRADHSDIVVLTYCIAGRAMITIERGEVSVTLITCDTSKESCMGLQGLLATQSEAVSLLEDTIDAWKSDRLTFKADDKVGLF